MQLLKAAEHISMTQFNTTTTQTNLLNKIKFEMLRFMLNILLRNFQIQNLYINTERCGSPCSLHSSLLFHPVSSPLQGILRLQH